MRCDFCRRPTMARFEWLEMVRHLHRRVANQRKEIARLLRIEAEYTAMLTAKAHAEYEAKMRADSARENT